MLAEHQIRLGLTVIADSVRSVEVARAMWRRAARNAGESVAVIEVVCSDADVHRHRLTTRVRDIAGFREPTWDEVMARRDEWEEWTEDRLVLDTLDPMSDNVARAVAYLGSDR